MEEVPAHMHPGPIVPDVLMRQHEQRSELIWSGDHKTCFTDLPCRRFGRNLFQCYSTVPRRLLCAAALGCTTDKGSLTHSIGLGGVAYPCIAASADDGCSGRPSCSTWCYMFVWLPYHDHGLVPSDLWRAEVPLIYYEIMEYHYPGRLRGNDHTYWATQHASHVEVWYQWQLHGRDGLALAVEVLSYPNDEYIRWYRGITRVYIGNPANRDTRSIGYEPTRVDRRMMTFPVQLSRCRPQEPVPDRNARGVKRGTRRQPGRRARGGRPLVSPFPSRHGHADPGNVKVERGEGSRGGRPPVDPFDSLNLDIPSFSLGLTSPFQSLLGGSGTLRSPYHTSLGFSSFRVPPSGTVVSSTPHQPISHACSSVEEEWADDMNDVHHLGFGHRVGKKMTRFTPSDWP
ncbi:hypothetical protein M9H77_25441 [Catharanthus roseus]|uniref:Uncharacterized protein n=1 Tax=Catharanthus roseus TaxID=4058 RepID=A0ACC0AB45_CATRO|nr:hypothetical protein M9H77_25441 [Catharanthus roseus]